MSAIHTKLLRIADNIRERRRWKQKSSTEEPCIYYGQQNIPDQADLLSGGLVKLQDLIKEFPNTPDRANMLYLISSALPPNPDILVKHAVAAKIPIVLNQNGVAYPAWHGPGWKETNERLNTVYRYASHIIFQSDFCKLSAEKYLGPAHCPNSILHNPVNTNEFTPSPQSRTYEGAPRLLVAGSHGDFYKVQTSLDTLMALSRNNTEPSLQIAGRCCWKANEDECLEDISSYARQIGVQNRIDITGPYTQHEAIKLFQAADILIHPTYNDSCPRLVVEAMACGVPVVYSGTGGTPELIPETAGIGVAGPLDWNRIIPPESGKLARAVLLILKNYDSFSAAARKHAAANHHVDKWIDAHRRIFSRLLASAPSI